MAKKDIMLQKEDFEFIQMNEKIFDKKFETKAVGYFGDALRRFRRNKTSVVAFVILMLIILMAIFMPMISPYDAKRMNTEEAELPPRIPFLENFGIADGTREYKEVNIQYIISKDDPKVDLLSNDSSNDEFYIENYYFLEYITNFDSIEEIEAAAYEKVFKKGEPDEVITKHVDIRYHEYHAILRPKWQQLEYSEYLDYQKKGIIKKDADGIELVEIDQTPAKNALIGFAGKYNRDNKTKYKWYDPEIAKAYNLANPDKPIESFYNVKAFVDKTLAADYKEVYHYFGTDNGGRDLWTRLWQGTRLSLLIGLFVAVVSITVGVIWGSISGYYGGIVDLTMERFTEILTGIPWIVIMTITKMLLTGVIPNTMIVAISLVLTSWTGTASMVRSQMYRYKNREYVLASRTLGAKDLRLIFKHILPNALGTIVTSCVLVIPSAIFFESSVAYLGLGIDSRTISIGNLLNVGREAGILEFPYLTLFPALLIAILMISFNMFGNGLRDALNPSLRGSE